MTASSCRNGTGRKRYPRIPVPGSAAQVLRLSSNFATHDAFRDLADGTYTACARTA